MEEKAWHLLPLEQNPPLMSYSCWLSTLSLPPSNLLTLRDMSVTSMRRMSLTSSFCTPPCMDTHCHLLAEVHVPLLCDGVFSKNASTISCTFSTHIMPLISNTQEFMTPKQIGANQTPLLLNLVNSNNKTQEPKPLTFPQ